MGSRTPDLRITRDSDSDDHACYQRKQVTMDRPRWLHRHRTAPFRSLCSSPSKINHHSLENTRSEATERVERRGKRSRPGQVLSRSANHAARTVPRANVRVGCCSIVVGTDRAGDLVEQHVQRIGTHPGPRPRQRGDVRSATADPRPPPPSHRDQSSTDIGTNSGDPATDTERVSTTIIFGDWWRSRTPIQE